MSLLLVGVLCLLLLCKLLREAFAPLAARLSVDLLPIVEDLVNFVPLHELADPREVDESEVPLVTPVEELKAQVDLFFGHIGTKTLRTLPELVFVHSARLVKSEQKFV